MISIDSTSSSGYEASLSTYNWNHTCSGPLRALVVGISILAAGTVTSVTYNNKNLTFINSVTNGIYRSELWYMTSPNIGTNSIVVNLSTSLTSIAGAASYNSINQESPLTSNSTNTGTGNPASISVTTVRNNDLVIGVLSTPTTSVVSSNNERWNNSGLLGSGVGEDSGIVNTPTAKSISWTNIGVADTWAAIGISLAEQTGNVFEMSTPVTNISIKNYMVAY